MSNEEFDFSLSSAEYLESPNKARIKALKRQLEKQGIKVDADKQNDLKALKLALLKGKVSDTKDEKQDDQAAQDKASSQGTKTREQEIAAAKLGADTKPSADQLVKQDEQDTKAEADLKENEVQSEEA